jgi:hypothetical protein
MKTSISVALVAVLVLAGCTSTTSKLPVRTDYSKTAAFHEWTSFRFASDSKGTDYHRGSRWHGCRAEGHRLRRFQPEGHADRQDVGPGNRGDPVDRPDLGDQDERHRTAERTRQSGAAAAGGIPTADRMSHRKVGGDLR